MKRKDAKEHSTPYKVGGLGLETLRRVSKNFPTELSVKYGTVHVLLNHILFYAQMFVLAEFLFDFPFKNFSLFWPLGTVRNA